MADALAEPPALPAEPTHVLLAEPTAAAAAAAPHAPPLPPAPVAHVGTRPFARALYDILERERLSARPLAAWSDDGKAFVVTDGARFASEVLPRHFNHAQLSSFQRQLNLYAAAGPSARVRAPSRRRG